jgi:phosphate transport system substrate-binding protein
MLRINQRWCAFLVLLLLINVMPLAWAGRSSDVIQIKGSDTMVNLGQAWAEAFMEHHPEASIAVTGGGSGTGIAALINGTCAIAQSSREITERERALAGQQGRQIFGYSVAIDALAVVVHPSNPVSSLTIPQLSAIFSGRITNWRDVGGTNLPILVLSRDRNSGTHVYFLEHVVRQGNAKAPVEFAASVLMMPSSQAIVEEVAASRGAIGYIGIGYVSPTLKVLAVSPADGAEAVAPDLEAAISGRYPIARPLLFYTPSQPDGLIKRFLEFVLSEEGQAVVQEMDFVPLPVEQRSSIGS